MSLYKNILNNKKKIEGKVRVFYDPTSRSPFLIYSDAKTSTIHSDKTRWKAVRRVKRILQLK